MENITVNGFNIRIDRISSLGEALWVRKNFLMNNEALSYKGTSYAKADVFLYNYDYLFNLPEVDWGDFWVIPMTVEGFMGTLYYGTYSKDEVREIYESKGIGLI